MKLGMVTKFGSVNPMVRSKKIFGATKWSKLKKTFLSDLTDVNQSEIPFYVINKSFSLLLLSARTENLLFSSKNRKFSVRSSLWAEISHFSVESIYFIPSFIISCSNVIYLFNAFK